MNKNKGFTLIELIVTIAIMITILIISIISFINVSKKKEQEQLKIVKEQIITAGQDFFETNSYYLESLTDQDDKVMVSLGKLVREDYLKKAVNPVTKKAFSECSVVSAKINQDSTYDYEFTDDSNNTCDEPDFVITYENGAPKLELKISKPTGNDNWHVKPVVATAKVETNGNGSIKEVSYCNQNSTESCNYAKATENEKKEYTSVDSANGKSRKVCYKATNVSGKSITKCIDYKVDMEKPNNLKAALVNGSWNEITNLGEWKKEEVFLTGKVLSKNDQSCNTKKATPSADDKYSGISKFEISTDNKNWQPFNYDCKNTLYKLSNGIFNRYIRAIDNAGNISDVMALNVKSDVTKPNIDIPESGTYTDSANIKISVSDNLSGIKSATVNNTPFTNSTNLNLGIGNHEVVVTATDNAGNVNTITKNYTVKSKDVKLSWTGTSTTYCSLRNPWGYSTIWYNQNVTGNNCRKTETNPRMTFGSSLSGVVNKDVATITLNLKIDSTGWEYLATSPSNMNNTRSICVTNGNNFSTSKCISNVVEIKSNKSTWKLNSVVYNNKVTLTVPNVSKYNKLAIKIFSPGHGENANPTCTRKGEYNCVTSTGSPFIFQTNYVFDVIK